jgi:hypothetical protein
LFERSTSRQTRGLKDVILGWSRGETSVILCLLAASFLTTRVCMPPVLAFSPEQIEAMHCALKRASARAQLTGATLVVELIAIRILELACGGEFDPDKITETVLAEFEL